MYDINRGEFQLHIEINPNVKNLQYFYEDDQGFNCFKVVRSAEMINHSFNKGSPVVHEQKFQVFSFYIETLGRIQVQEFLIKELKKPDPHTGN